MSSSPSSVPSVLFAADMRDDVMHEYTAGELIQDKYQLVSVLGRGGMGAVWRARNLALDSDVAIKLILNDGRQAQLAGRLVREARASARLNHSGIVRVFDVGTTPHGDAYLVMELLKGASLAEQLASTGRLAAIRAVQLFLPLAAALQSAHDSGIIHRDLKPDNFFLAETSGHIVPKVLDFGVAMDLNLDAHRITQAGTLLGSPAYMSPEQARGETNLDQRTDVWSFCVSLYEALTLETPFGDDGNYYVLLDRIVKAAPTPTLEHMAGDGALWQILARGLEKHPGARWPSMHSLGVALALWLESHDVAEDILGKGLRSGWLAPDSDDGLASLSEPPLASARISGSLGRPTDHPSQPPMTAQGTLSASTPDKHISSRVQTTLASTLRPPAAERRSWLLPVGALVAIACGVAAWGFGAFDARPQVSPDVGAALAAPQAEQQPAPKQRSASWLQPVSAPGAGLGPVSGAASSEPSHTVRQQLGKSSTKQPGTASKPTTPKAQAGVARGGSGVAKPQPSSNAAPPPEPSKSSKSSKPKLGNDLGF